MPTSGPQRAGAGALERYPKLGVFYEQITGDEDARVCKDIPESACRHLPRNFFAYLVSNFLSKVADELASARLVLPWLLGAAGAPAAFVGFLVPIREAGALLPQLLVAAYIRRLPKRKGVWIVGALLSASISRHLDFKILKYLIGMKSAEAVDQNFRLFCLFFSYFFFGFNPKTQDGYRQYDRKHIR